MRRHTHRRQPGATLLVAAALLVAGCGSASTEKTSGVASLDDATPTDEGGDGTDASAPEDP